MIHLLPNKSFIVARYRLKPILKWSRLVLGILRKLFKHSGVKLFDGLTTCDVTQVFLYSSCANSALEKYYLFAKDPLPVHMY